MPNKMQFRLILWNVQIATPPKQMDLQFIWAHHHSEWCYFLRRVFWRHFPKDWPLILWKIQWTTRLVDFTYELYNSRLLQSNIGECYGMLLGWPIMRRNKGTNLAVELNSWISLLISKVVCFGLYGTRWPSCNQRGNQHVGCQRMLEAMLRWHSFIPALAISSLLLMLLEHQRIRRIYQLLEGANSSQDGGG